MRHPRLDQLTDEALAAILDAHDCWPDGALFGLFMGIACGPAPVPEEDWLDEVYTAAPEAESEDLPPDSIDVVELYLRQMQADVVAQMHDVDLDVSALIQYLTEGADVAEVASDFCSAFLDGFALSVGRAGDDMEHFLESNPALIEALGPIMLLGWDDLADDDADDTAAPEGTQEDDEPEPEELIPLLTDAVRRTYAELHAIKPARSDKTPRNAPCPCGSGRKYKYCCGK